MKLITSLYSNVTSYVATLNRDTKGATAIEYAVIAGLLAVALILGVTALGGGLEDFFDNIVGALPGTSELTPAG